MENIEVLCKGYAVPGIWDYFYGTGKNADSAQHWLRCMQLARADWTTRSSNLTYVTYFQCLN